MKFILPLILIALVIWLLMRRRDDGDDRGPRDPDLPPPLGGDEADRDKARKEKIDAD